MPSWVWVLETATVVVVKRKITPPLLMRGGVLYIKLTKMTDEEIVWQVQKGDKEIYARIVKRYQDKLIRYATYLVGDFHLASDVVQETFIKAYVNLNGFNVKKKFSSWIYRIAHNEAMNVLKKDKKQFSLGEYVEIDSNIDLEENLIKKELKTQTQRCLKQMSVIYREPLSLYFLEDKTYEEISDILRIPMGTVGTRINRAKVIMKKICQK